MRKDVCFGVIALTWVLSAVLASPLAIFREYRSFTLEPGHTIQVHTHTHTQCPLFFDLLTVTAPPVPSHPFPFPTDPSAPLSPHFTLTSTSEFEV